MVDWMSSITKHFQTIKITNTSGPVWIHLNSLKFEYISNLVLMPKDKILGIHMIHTSQTVKFELLVQILVTSRLPEYFIWCMYILNSGMLPFPEYFGFYQKARFWVENWGKYFELNFCPLLILFLRNKIMWYI